ncbi:MAG TPA: CBS domain-containing protein [Candidatus Acidoferrales bacterium]|nr:CBS domain-containing protein [Candidatus Acidoferrales bacterium]
MLHATELLGAEVRDAQGNFVGRVRELFIVPADHPGRISRILLARGRYQPLVARHDQVATAEPGRIGLTVGEQALESFQANEAWLAVGKDLLDQQIIDVNGRKVVRVNDVNFDDRRTNGNVELRVFQVDAGFRGAAGRLLQGLLPPAAVRKLQQRLPATLLPWEYVNLIESDPMRRVKLRIGSDKLAQIHPAELADIVEELTPGERQSIIESLDKETAAETLAELDDRLQPEVVETLGRVKAGDILEEMDPDEAADLLAELPPETSKELLAELPRDDAQEVKRLLQYEERSAGGMMTTEFVLVGEDAERDEVVGWIRGLDLNAEQLDTILLINKQAVLAGTVAVGRLLMATSGTMLADLRSDPVLFVGPEEKAQEVFELFDKYNLRSLAVVDANQRPLGVITVDDVIKHLREKE